MQVQNRLNVNTIPFLRHGIPANKDDATILQDAGRVIDLARYTVMGKSQVAVGAVTPDGGNTGDGTVTGFALAAGPSLPIVGDYNLECIAAVANGGTFKLEDPNGVLIANNLVMTAGAGAATAFIVAGMTFIITDGATDFIVGDKFALTIAAVGKYLPLNVAEVNGLQNVKGIYLGDGILAATIVAGDVTDQLIMVAGNGAFVDENQIVLENSLTLDTVLASGDTIREALYKLGIIPQATDDISDYENA